MLQWVNDRTTFFHDGKPFTLSSGFGVFIIRRKVQFQTWTGNRYRNKTWVLQDCKTQVALPGNYNG